MTIAEIIVFRGIKTPYHYQIPDALKKEVQIGSTVVVPIGKTECQGVVVSINTLPTASSPLEIDQLRSIVKINPDIPELPQNSINLVMWFSQFYNVTPYKALQTVFGKRKRRSITEAVTKTAFSTPFSLTNDQKQAISMISNGNNKHPYLLHGVTGSGKTEIYIQLSANQIQLNQQTLILVPEIALTPQYTNLFTKRFGDQCTIVHSGLTPKYRDLAWQKIKENKSAIVIGPRSAIFSPFFKLGLIIIDEHHDNSYKQDNSPRYDVHHIASYLSQVHSAKIVLGSATPRLSNLFHTLNTPQYIPISQRATGVSLPKVTIIDMTQTHTNELLSRPLIAGIKTALSNSEKVMILLNRRGFAPTIICQSCHRYFSCPECQLSYTYHQDKRLRCHRCATTVPVTNTCPNCCKSTLKFSGIGIQKVEAELKSLFPNQHITRLDKDIAKSANDVDNILTEFKNNGDILLGTQLIAKGHDIPQVSMVGVIGIDTSLNLPDFKSTENAFQLLTQVSGRAGRQNKQGNVFIQTNYPDHYVFTHSKAHDSIHFLQEESCHRKAMYYPPFCTLINIILSSPTLRDANAYARTLHTKLLKKLDTTPDLEILPVKPCPFEKIKNHYRVHIVLKCPSSDSEAIKETIYRIVDESPPPKRAVRTVIDYDAQQLL